MTRKTRYILPAFVAAFALMFIAATPNVAANESDRSAAHHYWKKHMPIQIEGFEGNIPIMTDSDRHELKEKVTVSLSEAAEGLDVYKARLGTVINENDEKFLVWFLLNFEKDIDSGTVVATTYIVDAADSSNTAQITREHDHSKDDRKFSPGSLVNNIERLEAKFLQPTGDEELDQLRSEFVKKIQELGETYKDGDSEKIQELNQGLKDLRIQLKELRGS